MTRFKGFATKEEAKAYQKEHGGRLCGKTSHLKADREYFEMAVLFGGLSEERFPWCLQWTQA